MMLRETIVLCLTAGLALPVMAASQDGNVEWGGLSHVAWQDRTPRVPMDGESFTVRFQSYQNDLTSASVQWDDGAAHTAAASVVASRGPYDIWEATLPGTASATMSYVIEAVDGADADFIGPAGVSDNAPANEWTLDFVTLDHAPIGSTPVAGGTVFKVWAPTRTSCNVRGEFNNWTTGDTLTKVGEHFSGFVAGAAAGDMYKYYFNGDIWKPDARGQLFVPTDNYNTVIVDPDAYTWQTEGFSPDPLDQLVIYQLHVGTFAGRNDPQGATPNPSRYIDVAARADHLADLGVNAVMLNPINEFPGDFSGGYNSINTYSVESKLGDVEGFKEMVDALHARGIAVLLDIVWNHVSVSDNFLWDYDGSQAYFDTPAQDTPWGAQADYHDADVQEFYLDSVDLFLGDYRLDGYRMDAVMAMTDSGWTAQWSPGQTIVRGMNDQIDQRYADKHTIAEIYIDNAWVTADTPSGLGFGSQYHNAFKNNLRGAVFAEAGGGSPNMGSVAGAINGTGGSIRSGAFNYFELHDDAWPLNGHERAVREWNPSDPDSDESRGLQTLANGLTITSQGVPAILQGTEWLEDDGWESSKIDWSHKSTYAGVFAFYSDLIALRTSEPALYAESPISVYHVNESSDVMAFERYQIGGESFVVVANISSNSQGSYQIGLPRAGEWGVVINNDAAEFGGNGTGTSGTFTADPTPRDGFDQQATLSIPAYGFMVLRHEPGVGGCNAADIVEPLGVLDLADITAFVAGFVGLDPVSDMDGNGVWDLADISAFIAAFTAGCP